MIGPASARKAFLWSLSREEREKFLEQEKDEKLAKEVEIERVYKEGQILIVDFSFVEKMKVAEIDSLLAQIRMSVGFLRKQIPQYFKLVCSGVSADLQQTLLRKGSKSWKIDLYFEDVQQIPIVHNKNLVILSPDATEILDNVDLENSVYIIGGLVDKTILSKQTLQKSQTLGIKSVRFPLKESLSGLVVPYKLKKVLNITTVIEILHRKASGLDWPTTLLSSIPRRWLKPLNI
jgi:tRNA (guanine9-N1)-methyltransferase